MDVILAADIGGTKLAAGVVGSDGRVLGKRERPTSHGVGAESLYRDLYVLLLEALGSAGAVRADVVAIGVGCGGPMRYPEGLVSPLNIPAWRDFPLRPKLEADFNARIVVDNDAKAFALGEHWLGEGRGSISFLGMVVSTGVGGGIVQSGQLLHGAHGNAGHIGHMTVFPNGNQCACGAQGCLEAEASGPSLARQARRYMERGTPTVMPAEPTGWDLAFAASAGDRLALRLFRRAGVALGRGIASATALFDLDRVVIGGGLSNAADFFLPALQRELASRAQLGFAREVEVKISTGTVESTLVGAARMVLDR